MKVLFWTLMIFWSIIGLSAFARSKSAGGLAARLSTVTACLVTVFALYYAAR